MPNLAEQLKRDGHLLAKSPRPKKQPKRIPAMSAKRKKEAREYSKLRKAFFEGQPLCGAYWFIWPNRPTRPIATDIHHMRGRGKYYLDTLYWLPVCREAHLWIHANPKEARALGLLA